MWNGYVFLLFSESLSNDKKENNQTIFLLVLPIISSHLLYYVSFLLKAILTTFLECHWHKTILPTLRTITIMDQNLLWVIIYSDM